MHPELLNNSVFLRYYNQWRENPDSILFVPLAEYYLHYGEIDQAIQICVAGVKKHPHLVTGRLVLAKAYYQKGSWESAKEQLVFILNFSSNHQEALNWLRKIELKQEEGKVHSQETPRPVATWETVTMARILEKQGHADQAYAMYQNILNRDPNNQEARERIESLRGSLS